MPSARKLPRFAIERGRSFVSDLAALGRGSCVQGSVAFPAGGGSGGAHYGHPARVPCQGLGPPRAPQVAQPPGRALVPRAGAGRTRAECAGPPECGGPLWQGLLPQALARPGAAAAGGTPEPPRPGLVLRAPPPQAAPPFAERGPRAVGGGRAAAPRHPGGVRAALSDALRDRWAFLGGRAVGRLARTRRALRAPPPARRLGVAQVLLLRGVPRAGGRPSAPRGREPALEGLARGRALGLRSPRAAFRVGRPALPRRRQPSGARRATPRRSAFRACQSARVLLPLPCRRACRSPPGAGAPRPSTAFSRAGGAPVPRAAPHPRAAAALRARGCPAAGRPARGGPCGLSGPWPWPLP